MRLVTLERLRHLTLMGNEVAEHRFLQTSVERGLYLYNQFYLANNNHKVKGVGQ